MPARLFTTTLCTFLLGSLLSVVGLAQAPATQVGDGAESGNWRTSRQSAATSLGADAEVTRTALGSNTAAAASNSTTRVSSGEAELPREHGQQYLRYDISPYTSRVTNSEKPEQAIVDWILRETGTEVWFAEPFGFLNADRKSLKVYHTPDVHKIVREVCDRFNASEAESHVFGVQLVTVGSPNWRSKLLPLMTPVNVQTPGMEAWLITKENAAVMLDDLRKRTDFREHNSPNLVIHNGQAQELSRMRPRNYVRSVRLLGGGFQGHELDMAQVEEGFSLMFSPLLSLDRHTIDAVIKCQVQQIEKLVSVPIEVPAAGGDGQRVEIQVPQIVNWRIHERFRWPTDRVLVVSCGVVATPSPDRPNVLGLPNPFNSGPGRADAILLIESKGKASQALLESGGGARTADAQYQGRY